MHIKQVIIRGFKTYKDQVSLAEDFAPGVNVVVGFNGSGKSNFFNAILFVISDHYSTMRAELRKSLLHEGSGPAVITAFVEIVFDNSDRRLPIDRDEVHIRRTIGAKKDDYSLDGKHATRVEVFNLLESCGFTKSNPYYIVQQGKVSELTLMSDRRRLELLKEISGAHVFEERRAESEKILEEVQTRRLRTDDIIETISKRIRNLEEEQRELAEFQKLERQRKCLEYEITDREWRTAQTRIDKLEGEKRDAAAKLNEIQRQEAMTRASLGDVEADLHQATNQRERHDAERGELERTRRQRLEELTRVRLELDDEQKRAEVAQKSREDAVAEVAKLKDEAGQVSKTLEAAQPKLAAEEERRRTLAERKLVIETVRDQLLAKQGRRSQYRSIHDRNKALGEDVERRRQRRVKCASALEDCLAQLRRSEEAAHRAAETAKARQADIAKLEQSLTHSTGPKLAEVTQELEKVAEERRLLIQDRERHTREREEAERLVAQCQNRIDGTMPRPTRNAITDVMRWVREEGIQDQVYGTLLDNMTVDDTFSRAVENTAGNSIFNLLVSDEHIAGRIVSYVRRENRGNIVCTPMNQIVEKQRVRQYPKIQGVKPLVDVIQAPEHLSAAVRQVFGKTVVCQTLELGDEVSRKHGLDAVTLEGDKVSSRGTLTGGYQDPARVIRVKLACKARQARATAQSIAPRLQEISAQAERATARLDELHSLRRQLQDGRGAMRGQLAQAAESVQEAETQAARHAEAVRRHRERQNELKAQLSECDAAINALEAEMRTNALTDLSANEQARLQQATDELNGLTTELNACEENFHQMEREQKRQEQHLHNFLRKRIHTLQADIMKDGQNDHEEHAREKAAVLERVEREYAELGKAVDDCMKKITAAEEEIGNKKGLQEKLLNDNEAKQAEIAHLTGVLDDIIVKANAVAKRRSEADEKLRSLTVTSSDMPKYKEIPGTQLVKDLAKIHRFLEKYSHVNKKAIDQFTTFADQLRDLEKKRDEADEARASIVEFIRRVDEQKEDTLSRTLVTVNAHFSQIFSELVRGGKATLRMLQPGEHAEGDEDADTPVAAGALLGVRVEASFTGQQTTFLTMAQLSGGQKTVVAISLVFAIQRLEPAPFYLFDEIDAALDTQYRTAIAKLIAKDANNAQMIITTFRPEIIETADKFYRVYQKNRVSQIACVQRAEAKRVIEEQIQHDKIDG